VARIQARLSNGFSPGTSPTPALALAPAQIPNSLPVELARYEPVEPILREYVPTLDFIVVLDRGKRLGKQAGQGARRPFSRLGVGAPGKRWRVLILLMQTWGKTKKP
jgi:hypothetical protein